MPEDNWLAEIGIVNEITPVWSVSIFRSAADACLFFDECGRGSVLAGNGDKIQIKIKVDGAIEVLRTPYPDGKRVVRSWLLSRAANTLNERKRAAQKGTVVLNAMEVRDQLPSSIESLIAYIGFSS